MRCTGHREREKERRVREEQKGGRRRKRAGHRGWMPEG
jgi:hypothetical protein